jgi:hypothetical protein
MLSPNIEANQDSRLAELVRQVSASHGAIGLSVNGDQQAVMLSLKAFKQLLAGKVQADYGKLSEPEFHKQFQQVLVEAGFDTREKIIDLVRDVKREVAEEYGQLYAQMHHTPSITDS